MESRLRPFIVGAVPIGLIVYGADSELGRRVLARLAALAQFALRDVGEPIDVVVHLGSGDHDAIALARQSVTEGVVEMLAGATAGYATHVVLVSSAMVYGAVPNNPVPLTEEAVLRPEVEFVYARQLATAEALVDQWRRDDLGRTATVLRPVVTMDARASSSLARALAAGFGQRFGEDDPPAQFVHLDDLAAAVVVGAEQRLDGVFNVSPDGWVPGERVRELTGSSLRMKLPERVSEVWSSLQWRFQRGPIPPGLRPYTRSPWVVANDRLKAHGWAPTVTNEQAYVEGTEAGWWTMITPKRRQELSLGAMVAGLVAGLVAGFSLWRRWRRRR